MNPQLQMSFKLLGKVKTFFVQNDCSRVFADVLSLSCRLIHVPGCIIAGILGLVIDIPLFTAIAVIKSPYLLFKGWYRLAQDTINREGPFLEIACIPVAGLTILLWPIIVIGFVLMTIFSSIFIGLYGAVVVFQVHNMKPNGQRLIFRASFLLCWKLCFAGKVICKRSVLCDCSSWGI